MCVQAIMEKKKRQQEALVKKQKRSAAMQAMLGDPGFTGVDAAVDVTQEVPAWVMDGGIRCVPSQILHDVCLLWQVCNAHLAAADFALWHRTRPSQCWLVSA